MTKPSSSSHAYPPLFNGEFKGFLDLVTGPVFSWSISNAKGDTPLSWVIRENNWALFEKILMFRKQKEDSIRIDTHSVTQAWLTSKHGGPYLKALLENGLSINSKSAGAPLLTNAVSSSNPHIVELLIKEGADLEAVDGMSDTALIYAASGGEVCDLNNLRMLLKYKPNLDYQNKYGMDALAVSCDEWPLSLPELLKAGADPHRRYQHGKTLLMFFKWQKDEPEENFEQLGYPTAIDTLLELGLSLDGVDEAGNTVMSYYTKSDPLSRYMIQKQREKLDQSLPLSNVKGKVRI